MVDVLVVDDEPIPGRSFARIIRNQTKLDTVFTDDPRRALEIVKQANVKVAVLDQRMPQMTGTRLYQEIRRIDPNVRAILFSGQAEFNDLADAVGKFAKFLDKNDIGDLATVVKEFYVEYVADLSEREYDKPEIIGEYRSGFSLRGSKVKIELLALSRIVGSENVWLEEEFQSIARLNVNEVQTFSRKDSREFQMLFENEIQTKSASEIQDSVKASMFVLPVRGELARQVRESLERTVRQKLQNSSKEATEEFAEVTYSLPFDGADGARMRDIQQAPIYERQRAVVRIHCQCCEMTRYDSFVLLTFTGRWKTRQVDYMDDNSRRIVETN